MAQIFGFTPIQKRDERYVPFLAIHKDADADLTFEVRNSDGTTNRIMVPSEQVDELLAALRSAVGR